MKCPLCLLEVPQLKTNSHVIPRFLCKQFKENGKGVSISQEEIDTKHQSDIKGDIVCAQCEDNFTVDDNFLKDFIDNQSYFVKRHLTTTQNSKGYDEFDPSVSLRLKKAIMSIILRYHLYEVKYSNKDFLGPHFEEFRLRLTEKKDLDYVEYPLCMITIDQFKGLGTPSKEKNGGINSVFLILKKYRFWIYIDSRHIVDKPFQPIVCSDQRLVSPIIDHTKSKLYSDILEMIDKNLNTSP